VDERDVRAQARPDHGIDVGEVARQHGEEFGGFHARGHCSGKPGPASGPAGGAVARLADDLAVLPGSSAKVIIAGSSRRPRRVADEDGRRDCTATAAYQEVRTMYAVIKTGGKQYRVAAGEKLKIEQIPADIGAEITIDQVLAVGSGDQISVGAPLVDGATVSATVLAQGRHDKIRIFK